MEGIVPVITILGASQGVILSIALIFKKQNALTNRILAVFIILLSQELIARYIVINSGYSSLPGYMLLVDTFGFLYGPLMYFYTGLLTSQIYKLNKRHLLHFIPFVLYLFYDLLFFGMKSQEQLQFTSQYLAGKLPSHIYFIDSTVYIALLIYLILIFRMEAKYSKHIAVYFSDHAKINLRWLKIILFCVFVLWIFAFISYLMFLSDMGWSSEFDWGFYFLITVFIYIIGYFALFQPEIFFKTHQMEKSISQKEYFENETKVERTEIKYSKTKLSDDILEMYLDSINKYIRDTKIFLNPEITIKELSDDLEIPTHHISQTINSLLNKNFFHYINHFRIEEAKKFLADTGKKNLPVLSIAFESGFNSKATFNSVFKKYTGYTPTQYRNIYMQ